MNNIEIKCPLADRGRLVGKLERLGARLTWTRRQVDTFFRTEQGWLKLREAEGEQPELIAYRRPGDEVMSSEYGIALLPDAGLWKRLLGLALGIDGVVRKERTLYVHGRTRIHLDRVEGLGDFLELESVVGDENPEEARQETEELIEALELDRSTFQTVPYRDQLRREAMARSSNSERARGASE